MCGKYATPSGKRLYTVFLKLINRPYSVVLANRGVWIRKEVISMKKLTTTSAMALALAISANSAMAADFKPYNEQIAGILGHVGGAVGGNYVEEVDGGTNDEATVFFGRADASVGFRTQSWLFGVEGEVRYDDFQSASDFDDDEDPEWQWTVTPHFLYDVSSATRIGLFGQYGDNLPQDGDEGDSFDHYLIGIEGQTFLADNVVVFGQLAFGDKITDGQDDQEGFNNGIVVRTGLTYFATEFTALTADFEFAGSENYIDSSDPGRHFGASIGGKTQISEDMSLFFTYEASYTHINSTDESEQADELAFAVGIELPFGAKSLRSQWTDGMAIGAPRLPVRASALTEYID